MNFPIEEIRKVVGFGNELTLKFQFGKSADETLKVMVQPSIQLSGPIGSKESREIDAALSSPLVVEGTELQIAEGFLRALQNYRTVRESLSGLRTNLQEIEEAEKQARATVVSRGSRSSRGDTAPAARPEPTEASRGLSCGEDSDERGGAEEELQPLREEAPPPTPSAKPTVAGNPSTLF